MDLPEEPTVPIALVLLDVRDLVDSVNPADDASAGIVELAAGRMLDLGAFLVTDRPAGGVDVNPTRLVSGAALLGQTLAAMAEELGVTPSELIAHTRQALEHHRPRHQ